MNKLKKRTVEFWIVLLSCFLIGGVAHASESASSEVRIAIETAQIPEYVKEAESVHTGDGQNMMVYIFTACVALLVIIACVIKKRKLFMMIMLLFLFLMLPQTLYAAETTENIDVTVPSNLFITFEEDGTTSVSEFTICNDTQVPILIKKIHVEERNEWELCKPDKEILVDTKQLELKIEQQCLNSEQNIVDIPIEYNTSKSLDIQVRRGAWSTSQVPETAFDLEFEYELGTREFRLAFDANGSAETFDEQMVCNGSTVDLPTPFRIGHEFLGWVDSVGKVYTKQYVMPLENVCLKARWREVCGYALYLESDQSLRFVYPSKPICVGDMYDGFTVTAVYAIPRTAAYTNVRQVPWYDNNSYKNNIIKKVIVEDTIQPQNTAYWFANMSDCAKFELDKLDTSNVTDMTSMFYWAGYNATTFEITGIHTFDVSRVKSMKSMFSYMAYNTTSLNMNLQNWAVYNVTDMSYMFAYMAHNSKSITLGYLSQWDVRSVTNMDCMFRLTGYKTSWYLYLSPWNVSNVKTHLDFNYGVHTKVIAPLW